MTEIKEGSRVETIIGKRRGTVDRIYPEGTVLVLDVTWDRPFNGTTRRSILYQDVRPLGLLELIAEAAQ